MKKQSRLISILRALCCFTIGFLAAQAILSGLWWLILIPLGVSVGIGLLVLLAYLCLLVWDLT